MALSSSFEGIEPFSREMNRSCYGIQLSRRWPFLYIYILYIRVGIINGKARLFVVAIFSRHQLESYSYASKYIISE